MVLINLLPWREQHREQLKQQFLLMLALTIGASFLIVLFTHFIFSSRITSQRVINSYLAEEIVLLDKQIDEIKTLKGQKKMLLSRINVIHELQADRPRAVRLFDEMIMVLPNGVYVTHIRRLNNKVTIQGKTESNARISKLMKNIEKSIWLSSPQLRIIKNPQETEQESDDWGSEFELQLTQKRSQTLDENEL